MSDTERKRKILINAVYYIMLAFGAFLLYRYAFGVCFPILFAFFVAVILQRPKNFLLRKTGLKKGFASTVCVIGLMLLVAAVLSLVGVRAVTEIKSFVDYLVLQAQNVDSIVNTVEDSLMRFVAVFPDFIEETLNDSIGALFTEIREFLAGRTSDIPDKITGGLNSFDFSWLSAPLTGVISTAKQIPSVLIAIVVSVVLACFITADFDFIKNFVRCQFSEEKQKDLTRASTLLRSSLTKMAKAYALIMIITFGEIFLGFSVLSLLGIFNSGYTVILAIIIAIIDIVPVLGTGTVLLPWIVYSLIVGDYAMAIGLAIIYAVVSVIRQIIEPKLVAGQLGLPPFVTLIAMYLGLKIFGVLGVFVLPIIIIMLKLLNDEGIIHLWRKPSDNA